VKDQNEPIDPVMHSIGQILFWIMALFFFLTVWSQIYIAESNHWKMPVRGEQHDVPQTTLQIQP
jgi:hypothetical protein